MSPKLRRNLTQYGLLSITLLILGTFLILPIFLTVRGGLIETVQTAQGESTRWTLQHVALVFANPLYREGLINTFLIACAVTSLATLISLPLALLSARYTFPFKPVFNAMILVPLILPPFVGAIGMRAILGRQGMLNALLGTDFDVLGRARIVGVIIVETLHLYPIIYLNATAALANLDPALDEAAENLGAGPWRRFFKIVLPLIRPGLFAGGTIVFIWSFTELGTPLMFDYNRVTPVQIFSGLKEIQSSAVPYALTIVLLAAAILWYIIGKLIFGRKGYAMYSKASRASAEHKLPWWGGLLAMGLFSAVTAAAILPHIGVVLTSVAAPWGWSGTVLPTAYTDQHFITALSDPVSSVSIR
ncbi:MAG TPA: iron ABC transporter permease, partial [Phycisphaerales bacterium]|nr:iron ABC transporter permease [Phycisphaerales bacterium]